MMPAPLALLLVLAPLAVSAGGVQPPPPGMVRIAAGTFRPLYGHGGESTVHVSAFALDTVPVSQADFVAFLKANPRWTARNVSAPIADANYLKGLTANATRPVTSVSWFAASAYCEARDARLPTTNEWEFTALASETVRDASKDPAFRQRVLELAMTTKAQLFLIGSGLRNVWGVRDLHGGVLEWTLDLHPLVSHAGSHNSSSEYRSMGCSAGAAETGNAADYAAFLRYAFRANAEQRTSSGNVGFRCAATLR